MSSQTNKSIAKNTMLLYIRLFFTVLIAFFTQRIVLKGLGVEDYGIYNVVGGIIAIIGIVNAGMVQASQRFFAYELGVSTNNGLVRVFGTSLTIHILLSFVVLILSEVIGVWFLNTKLNINSERIFAANLVYQCSVISFVVTVLTVPFNAMIISKEDFDIYAYVSIGEYFAKLITAYLILYEQIVDRLVFYACLLCFISLCAKLIYAIYCKTKFHECRMQLNFDRDEIKRMLSFASFSLIGNIGFIMRNQGVNIIVNIFFGTIINAARGVAYQVSSQISAFSTNFLMAAVPQITKSYASANYNRMTTLIYKASKYSFCLLFLLALPFIIKPEFLLVIWLGDVPEYADRFLRLALIVSIIDGMAIPIGKGIDATGRIKTFQICICILMFSDVPLSYFILYLGYPCYYVMYVAIFTSLLGIVLRIYLLSRNIHEVDCFYYIKKVVFPCLLIAIICILLTIPLEGILFSNTVLYKLLFIILTIMMSSIAIYFIGMEREEKIKIRYYIKSKLCHI